MAGDSRSFIYSCVTGSEPNEAEEIRIFQYLDDNKYPVGISYPITYQLLTPDNLAELGCIFLALAGKDRTPRIEEILKGYGLKLPKHLEQ